MLDTQEGKVKVFEVLQKLAISLETATATIVIINHFP